MSAPSPISPSPTATSTPHLLDSVAAWWSHALLLLSLLLMARATRAQSPDQEQALLLAATGGPAATNSVVLSFAYDGGSRCAGTEGSLTPALAQNAVAGQFSASPAGLSLDSSTGRIDLARSQAGAYTITNHSIGGAASASTFLVLNALPSPTLTTSGPTTFHRGGSVTLKASGGTPGATYQFFNNGQAIGGATGDTYTATVSGSYTVLVINPGSCVAASPAVAVQVTAADSPELTKAPLSTRPGAPAVELAVYPNPSPGQFTVAITGSQQPVQLTVSNALGQLIQNSTLSVVDGACHTDLTHLAPGVYILRATTSSGTLSRRIVRD